MTALQEELLFLSGVLGSVFRACTCLRARASAPYERRHLIAVKKKQCEEWGQTLIFDFS